MNLPEEFKLRMQDMLKNEYGKFENAFENSPIYEGMRINALKMGAKEKVLLQMGTAEQVPWCENGYYADKKLISGKHPYHVGGLVYFQEPSAMAPVSALQIKKGDIVLDLCAAPGGKSTQAAEALAGTGLLIANEIVPKRAKILAENIGRMGIRNAVVTNETPEHLSEKYEAFFDKIIVDAPCSGEGMFRKEPRAIEEWSIEHTKSCAMRQLKILDSAMHMLKKDGYLVYSTCTFAPCENEQVIESLLRKYSEAELVKINLPGLSDGRSEWTKGSFDMSYTKRVFPHISKGEGHFVALIHKKDGTEKSYVKTYKCDRKKEFYDFAKENLNINLDGEIISFGDKLYLLPHSLDIDKIKVELAGLFLGVCKKGRFEPSHELCLALEKTDFKRTQEIEDAAPYFAGETIPCDEKGWTAVLYNGFPIGWGKASGGILKNHFPKYLRF